MTLTIEELLRLEGRMRAAKDAGQSSNMSLKIAEIARLINFAKETFGEEKIEQARTATNLVQFKKDTTKLRTFTTWQDEQEKAERERQRRRAIARKSIEKQRKLRQEEELQTLARSFAGDQLQSKTA